MTGAVLEVRDLRAGYEDVLILDGVSIEVAPGSIVAVVGPNGAGKSTLLKAIYGLIRVRGGGMIFRTEEAEHDITRMKPYQCTALGMNYVPQLDNVFPALSVAENLRIGAVGVGERDAAAARERVLRTFPVLAEMRGRAAGSLSGGQRQMLALARALMSDPGLLLLDEPSAGLAPLAMDELFERLLQIHALGVGMLIVEQNARRALAMADYGYVLEGGRNRYEGRGADLLEDENVVQLYLGQRRTAATRREARRATE